MCWKLEEISNAFVFLFVSLFLPPILTCASREQNATTFYNISFYKSVGNKVENILKWRDFFQHHVRNYFD